MAHRIEVNAITGKAEIAYTGEKPWHGLGQVLPAAASIEDWITAAQMDWTIEASPVQYVVSQTGDTTKRFNYIGQQVLFRSDTYKPLGVVSDDFNIVQPAEVLEFFRDLVERFDMKLSVAGCLFNGKRFWATAETGRANEVVPGDVVKGQLLLMTGADGTIATTAKFVSTRVVCNNTMQIALNQESGRTVRQTHKRVYSADSMKLDLGLMDDSWNRYLKCMQELSKKRMTDNKVYDFFKALATRNEKKVVEDVDLKRAQRTLIDDLIARYRGGLGAEFGKGTAWGALNAVTERFTHGTARRDANHQFVNSLYGTDAKVKDEAAQMLLAA